MFNSIKPDQNSQVTLVQQCLANYDYSNATALAEDLLLQHDSEENKGLLADCYLSQQENIKAYFLLKHSTSPLNLYKFAIACLRLNTLYAGYLINEKNFDQLRNFRAHKK